MSVWQDFKLFVMRGNVLDLAVGVVIGAAFGKIVSSLVTDILMPPLGLILGRVDFSEIFIDLSGQHLPTLAAAKAAKAPTLNIGIFLNNIFDFVIVAFSIFMVVKVASMLSRHAAAKNAAVPPAPTPTEALLTEIRDLLKK